MTPCELTFWGDLRAWWELYGPAAVVATLTVVVTAGLLLRALRSAGGRR